MAYVSGVLSFLAVAVWVYCLVDVATTPHGQSRVMNKWLWLVVVALFSLAGSAAWLIFGRPRRVPAGVGPAATGQPVEVAPSRPQRQRRPAPLAPDDNPEFLRRLDEIAELERRAREEAPPERDDHGPDGGSDKGTGAGTSGPSGPKGPTEPPKA